VYCSKCGKAIEDTDAFCRYCGTAATAALPPTSTKAARKGPSRRNRLILVLVMLAIGSVYWTNRSTDTPHRDANTAVPSGNPRVTPPLAATPSDAWMVSEDVSNMDGSKTVTLALNAENEVKGWLESEKPTLIIRCKENVTNAYIVTGMQANVESGLYGEHTVRLRFDDAPPVTQRWSESTDNKALFSPNAIGLARNLVEAETLNFEFVPFNASPVVAIFKLQGLDRHINKVSETCGWK
jgi:hypothetical protein